MNTFQFTKAVSDTVLDMINAAYYAKPLISIEATFLEKFVSQHRAVNINCWIRLSLSRLFPTLRKYTINTAYQDFDVYRGYVSGEAHLPSSGSEWSRFPPIPLAYASKFKTPIPKYTYLSLLILSLLLASEHTVSQEESKTETNKLHSHKMLVFH